MTEIPERVASLEAWSTGHEDQCKERYMQIKGDTAEIKGVLSAISADLKGAISRIHDRIDGQDQRISGLKIWVLTGIVGLLLSVVAYLLTTYGPFSK